MFHRVGILDSYIWKLVNSRGQPYVTLSLLSTANATALPATSGARGTECYRRSVGIVSLVVGLPFAPCLREWLVIYTPLKLTHSLKLLLQGPQFDSRPMRRHVNYTLFQGLVLCNLCPNPLTLNEIKKSVIVIRKSSEFCPSLTVDKYCCLGS